MRLSTMTNLLANPDIQDPEWFTDSNGNQRPKGYTYWVAQPGETLPVAIKGATDQDGKHILVNAVCEAVPENIHKPKELLPAHEWEGQPHQLIFPGRRFVYKSFGNQGAIATKLIQSVQAPPGSLVRYSRWVLVDAPDIPTRPDGQLEEDHAVVKLWVGNSVEASLYSEMRNRFDALLPDGGRVARPWNFLSVEGVVGNSGFTDLGIMMQKNWRGPTAIFLGPGTAEVVGPPPRDAGPDRETLGRWADVLADLNEEIQRWL